MFKIISSKLALFLIFTMFAVVMKQRIKYIIPLAVCIILCNQCFHLYHLYRESKLQYTHRYNNMISGTVYEFNMKSMDVGSGNFVSYNASTGELVIGINYQEYSFQLSEKDNVRQISEQSDYDVRDPQEWTLKNFHAYWQTKLDSMRIKNPSMQFVIVDSTGTIKESYPEQLETLSLTPEHQQPLGVVSGDTLYAMYKYPLGEFIRAVAWQLIITIIISALFIFCLVHLYRTIRDEKRRGEYREQFIHNLVHDLKQPIGNQANLCFLLASLPPDQQTSLLEQSQKQLNGILQSINRMLLHSTDSYGLRLAVEKIDLEEMLKELMRKELWTAVEKEQYDIQLVFQSENRMIEGDYHFLFAVFQNMIDNALKYSGEQVNIQITCEAPDARYMQIAIEDNGFGISPASLKHVFERFNRGDQQDNRKDQQDNRKVKGNGLGLYYARR